MCKYPSFPQRRKAGSAIYVDFVWVFFFLIVYVMGKDDVEAMLISILPRFSLCRKLGPLGVSHCTFLFKAWQGSNGLSSEVPSQTPLCKFRASTCALHPRVPGPPAETPGGWETLRAGKDEELQIHEPVFLGKSLQWWRRGRYVGGFHPEQHLSVVTFLPGT